VSASLAEKIRIARHKTVEVDGLKIVFNRPTDIQIANLYEEYGKEHSKYEVAKRFVIGWVDVKESDLFDGGSDKIVPFEADAFEEWLSDSREAWSPLYEAIMTAYVEYADDRETAIKN